MTELLLLHGLGAAKEVWDGVVAAWPGRAYAPDLAGHGEAHELDRYSFGGLAAALPLEDREYVVVGHSLGGVVGLALASGWFGIRPRAVVGIGIKTDWTSDELAKAKSMAERPPRLFPTRDEATAWAGRLAGLPELDAVVETEQGWRAAFDPRAFGVGAPDMAGLRQAARCPVLLAHGEHDHMSQAGRTIPGRGHNLHVEDPDAVVRLVQDAVSAPTSSSAAE